MFFFLNVCNNTVEIVIIKFTQGDNRQLKIEKRATKKMIQRHDRDKECRTFPIGSYI